MGVPPLSGNKVRNAVAIHVANPGAVQLRVWHDVSRFPVREVVHHHVLDEGAVALLLEPRQAPSVRGQRGDDIGQAVAVHIKDLHDGAARLGKGNGMVLPCCCWIGSWPRILPPSIPIEDIQAAVAVDVAHPNTMPSP